jgi:hypothetical protein
MGDTDDDICDDMSRLSMMDETVGFKSTTGRSVRFDSGTKDLVMKKSFERQTTVLPHVNDGALEGRHPYQKSKFPHSVIVWGQSCSAGELAGLNRLSAPARIRKHLLATQRSRPPPAASLAVLPRRSGSKNRLHWPFELDLIP